SSYLLSFSPSISPISISPASLLSYHNVFINLLLHIIHPFRPIFPSINNSFLSSSHSQFLLPPSLPPTHTSFHSFPPIFSSFTMSLTSSSFSSPLSPFPLYSYTIDTNPGSSNRLRLPYT
ncbi:hypothetical protein OTU49_002962, partial [Cherax quadricarinatus]